MKHKSKRIIALILAVVFVLSLVEYRAPLKVLGNQAGEGTEGVIKNVTKTADGEGDEEERIYKLSFTANFKDVLVNNKEKFPIDVILLIDMSTSMTDPVKGTNQNRLQVMKDVATHYVDELAEYCDESTLSIATYYNSSDIISYPVMVDTVDNRNDLKDKIASIDHKKDENTGVINQLAGTNHDYGFMRAKEILEYHLDQSENQKYIILLTDGAPNAENRNDDLDKALYKEYELEQQIKYTKWNDELGKYETHDYTLKHREEIIQDGEVVMANGIQSRNVLRDYCVVTMLNQIYELDDKIKVATVGFETLYEEADLENLTDSERKEALSNMRHIQDLFDVVTGAEFDEEEGAYVGANTDYQFYTNSTTSLKSIFEELLENFAEENTVYSRPTVIDYIAAGFVPLNDARQQITVDEARTGVTLSNGAEVKYDDVKSLYYVVWPVGEALNFDVNTAWASEVYIQAKDDFVGGEDIPTNAEDSGVYVNDELIEEFDIPTVDVYVREYDVTYEFVSGTPGKTLPELVTDLCPGKQENVKDGTTITPTLDQTEVYVDGGKWKFKEWDEASKTIASEDLSFEGTWEYVDTYDVTYGFTSITPGMPDLPQEVLDLIPETQENVESGTTVTPIVLEQTEVLLDDGRWTFVSWNKQSELVDGLNDNFMGIWEYTEYADYPTYEVEHSFVSITDVKDLPQEVLDLIPGNQTDVKDGSTVYPTAPDLTEVEVDGGAGKWVFKGWDADKKRISQADQNFEGRWEYVELYDVTYSFTSGTTGKELPQAVKDLIPVIQEKIENGSTVTPSGLDQTEVVIEAEDGKWVFKNWDATSKVISGGDQNFVGTWEFVENPKYDVTHEFVSGTAGKELPQAVKDLIPGDKTGNKNGSTVTPSGLTQTEVVIEAEDGKWVFDGWDAGSKEISGDDVSFVGTWKFEENPKYDVTHQFVSGTAGKELPQAVKDLIPGDKTGNKNGSTVTPSELTQTEVVIEAEDGKWVFKNWDATSKVISGEDQNFVGTWEFEENPKYDVTYEFVSGTEGKTLPEEVKDLLPDPQTNVKDGSTVKPVVPEKTEVLLEDGKWTFVSWDEPSKVIDGSDDSFEGTWVYSEYEDYPTYEVTHQFVSGTSGKELPKEVLDLLPSKQTDKKDGSVVKPTKVTQTEVYVEGGKWKFKAWDADEKHISKADQNFTGTWEYVDTYDVTYEFISGTEGKELPDEVLDLLPEPQTKVEEGSTLKPPVPEKTEVILDDSIWTFVGWDEPSKEIDGPDQSFVGTWEHEVRFMVVFEFVSGTSGKELPKEVLDLLPSEKLNMLDGSVITPEALASLEIAVEGGKWVFKLWDADQKKILGANEKFIGTWVFVATVPEVPATPSLGDNISANMWYYVSFIAMLVVVAMVFVKKKVSRA